MNLLPIAPTVTVTERVARILRTQWTETIMKATGATSAANGCVIEHSAFKAAMRVFRSDEATYRELYGFDG